MHIIEQAIVDDEPHLRKLLQFTAQSHFEVLTASSAEEAEHVIGRRPVDLILADMHLAGRSGVELLEWVWKNYPATVRLLMSGWEKFEDAVAAINRCQVYHFFRKPFWPNDVVEVLLHARDQYFLERKLEQEHDLLKEANRRLTEKLEQEAITDPLTGLDNRGSIEKLARREVNVSIRHRSPLGIGLLEIDPPPLPQTGPLPGIREEVIREVAGILDRSLRSGGPDAVGRLDWWRFLIVAPKTEESGIRCLADRIRAEVTAAASHGQGRVSPVTVSVGFAVAKGEVTFSFEEMMRVAADALAEARTADGNRSVVRRVATPPAPGD
jgi:diguanylate cyclase (GGDEF)-like protein